MKPEEGMGSLGAGINYTNVVKLLAWVLGSEHGSFGRAASTFISGTNHLSSHTSLLFLIPEVLKSSTEGCIIPSPSWKWNPEPCLCSAGFQSFFNVS